MTVAVKPENQPTIEAAFWKFHRENPGVYDELVKISRGLLARGYERFGIATVYEVARWRSMLATRPGDALKLNNNYRAYYARLMMERQPELRGVFNTRQLAVPHHAAP